MRTSATCYVYDDDIKYVHEAHVTITSMAGYTQPTEGEIEQFAQRLQEKLHKTESALRRMAHSSPYDLAVEVDMLSYVRRGDITGHLQEQADQYDADRVSHLR